MKVYKDIKEYKRSSYPVVTVGTFDGLHVGHQKIIHRMKKIAEEQGGETVLVTFDPHPRQVLSNNTEEIKFISTQKRKHELLDSFGIDQMIIVPFTRKFSETSSEDFIRDFLLGKIGVKKLIVGYDHHFGKNREGNYGKLIGLGEKLGFEVEEIPAQFMDDQAVSSTKIRKALGEGDIRQANRMLGYTYSITGIVVEGNKIGRKINFPTANIEVGDEFKLIAAGGVYSCMVDIAGQTFHGMGNIGIRPTVGINGLVTEIHVFDFDRDIYGEEITIFFLDRIRDEQKFGSLELLREQLFRDKEMVIKMLKLNQ